MISNIRLDGFEALIGRLESLPAQSEEALERAGDRVAQVALQSKQRQVSVTYSRPIPTTVQVRSANGQISRGKKVRIAGGKKAIGQGAGKPAWERSGNWAAQQTIAKTSRFRWEVGTVGSAEAYEGRLASLPTGALGINRTNKATENALRLILPQIAAIVQQEIRNILRL